MQATVADSLSRVALEKAPPLVSGDRLTRDEFERRYRRMSGVNKAELVEGIVYMPSPVRFNAHSHPHWILNTWMGYYAAKTPGIRGGDNGTVRLDNDNEPQPDLFLLLPPHAGGKATVDEEDYISGPPALVCEVAASTVSIDAHAKKNAYRRNGVQEYLLWRVDDDAIDWYTLVAGDFVPLAPDADGCLHSLVFPGLSLSPPALRAHDLPALLATLDRSLASDAHAAFVNRLTTP